jgi:hypothetical protein
LVVPVAGEARALLTIRRYSTARHLVSVLEVSEGAKTLFEQAYPEASGPDLQQVVVPD